MPLTAPGSISNSGSRPFSNLFGRIAMDNYNIIKASENYYPVCTCENIKSYKISLKYSKIKPKTIREVIESTKLYY